MGGFLAFIGGRVDQEDHRLAEELFGSDACAAPPAKGAADAPHRAAVVRELLEETGLLLTSGGLTALPGPPHSWLGEVYRATGAEPPALDAFEPAGRWVTPDVLPIRYDTRFFLVDVPNLPEPRANPAELARAWFDQPSALLAGHRRLELIVALPTRLQLEALACAGTDPAGPTAAALAALTGASGESLYDEKLEASGLEAMPGIRQLPLRTPTLPPATHTNCYIVGHEKAVIIDPATYEDGERARLAEVLDSLASQGTRFEAVVLTHHHPDHVGAAVWTKDYLSVPIWAHPVTRDLLQGQVPVDALLHEGDRIDLGKDAEGEPFVLECLHTPGHAAGHLVFRDLRRRGDRMIVGDMVAAVGTIIVDPDEGDMGEYIRQLERLRSYPNGLLFPAHGPPIAAGHRKLEGYIKHRLAREERVFDALRAFGSRARAHDLLPMAYSDAPQAIWPLAERSCLAHLIKLVEDGRAQRTGAYFLP